MRPHISPEPIEAHLLARGFGTSHLEDARSHPQTSVCSDHFCTSHPLCEFTALACSELGSSVEIARVGCIDAVGLLACTVCESYGGTKVSVKVAVALEDVEFIGCAVLILAACQRRCSLEDKVDLRLHQTATLGYS
jgi:hypothetical protein